MRTIPETDPNTVIAFLAVVEHKSFRGAAMALNIPRSTLSQRVTTLEARLDTQLLTRTTRTVALTDIGEAFYREVAPAIAALSAAEDLISSLRARPAGRLRITAPYELGQLLFGALLGDYTARYPDVRLEVELADRQVNLVDEGFDLAIRVGPLADSNLVARQLGTPQHKRLFASPTYLSVAGAPACPEDLAAHRCLAMSGTTAPLSWAFSGPRKPRRVPIQPHIQVNSFIVLRELARAGAGIAQLPASYAEVDVANGLLVEVLADDVAPAMPLFAVFPSARSVSPALRAMLELVTAHLGGLDARDKCRTASERPVL